MFTLGKEGYTAYTPGIGGHLRILPPVRVELQLAWEWSGRRCHHLLSQTSGRKEEPRSVPLRVDHGAVFPSASLGPEKVYVTSGGSPPGAVPSGYFQVHEAAFGSKQEKRQSQAIQVAVTTGSALEKASSSVGLNRVSQGGHNAPASLGNGQRRDLKPRAACRSTS